MIMVQFSFAYIEESSFQNLDNFDLIKLATNQLTAEKVKFKGKIIPILEYRDSMLCLRDIITSDYTKKLKDRTNYFTWLNRELNNEVEKITKEKIKKNNELQLKVQKEISELESERDIIKKKFNDLYRENFKIQIEQFKWFIREKQIHELYFIIDPVISVHPDAVIFEGLSLDESSYGNLSVDLKQFDIEGSISYGTTNIDFTQKLSEEFSKCRSSDNLFLEINPGGLKIEANTRPSYIEKKIDLPESWVKGFLQISGAMSFPAIEFSISPNDLYNIINYMKGHKATQSPRALRFDLLPNRNIFVIFEPWNKVLKLDRIYDGKTSQTIRIWGRRRILLLERLIPHMIEVRLRLVGKGMPIFLRCELLHHLMFTLGLSGWTQNNWSQGVAFSTILGPGINYNQDIINFIKEYRSSSMKELESKFPNESMETIKETIAYLYRFGKAFYDLSYNKIRFRELSPNSFPETITNMTEKEKEAIQISQQINSIKYEIDKEHNISINCEFFSLKDKTMLTLTEDGVYMRSNCFCKESKTNSLNKTICRHILALISKFMTSTSE